MAAPGNHENEIKLRVASAEAGLRLLEGAGFRLREPRVFEANVLFDTAGLHLRQSRELIRIREVGGKCVLTYKGTPIEGRHKLREELEVGVSGGADVLAAIFARLGLRPVFRYEKWRTEFHRPGEPGIATLDETPVGVFLELEGEPAWIDTVAGQLGFAPPDYVLSSYAGLYFEYCRERGIPPADMVFADREV